MNTAQTLTGTMKRIDETVRAMHEEREGHPCEGHWTARRYVGGRMFPREFVPTCCDHR